MIEIAIAVGLVLWIWKIRGRIALFFAAPFAFLYVVDGVLSKSQLTFSPSLRTTVRAESAEKAVNLALVALVTMAVLWTLGAAMRPAGRARPMAALNNAAPIRTRRLLQILLAATPLTLLAIRATLSAGLSSVLGTRQAFVQGSLVGLLSYSVAPALTTAAWVGARRGLRWRPIFWSFFAVNALATIGSGSRSNVVLSTLLPIACFEVIATGRDRRRRVRARTIVVAAGALGLALGLSAVFLGIRGTTLNFNPTKSTDIAQYDTLALVVDTDDCCVGTYGASLAFAIPRSLWVGKPVSGNVVLSRNHFNARYVSSHAEIAAGAMTEGYLNVGRLAPFAVALLLVLATFAIERMRRRWQFDSVTVALGYVFMIRSINLLRGDLTNAVVPAMSVLVICALYKRRRLVTRLTQRIVTREMPGLGRSGSSSHLP